MSGMNVVEYQSEPDSAHTELGAARKRVAELETELRRLSGGPVTHTQPLPFSGMRLLDVEGLLVK